MVGRSNVGKSSLINDARQAEDRPHERRAGTKTRLANYYLIDSP
jgi:GTP-binding protein EngB required for normal cell division